MSRRARPESARRSGDGSGRAGRRRCPYRRPVRGRRRRSRCSGCSASIGSSPPSRSRRGSTLSANGPLGRELRFEGKLAAGPIDAGGKGTLRFASDQPATLDFDQFAGTIGGSKVQGRGRCRFDEVPRIDGSIEAESLDAPAVIAAAIGMPAKRGAAGPAGPPNRLPGTRPVSTAASTSRRNARCSRRGWWRSDLSGVARFNGSEVVFEDVAGEIGKGRLDGRLAVSNGAAGLTARLRARRHRRRTRRDLRQRRPPGDVRPSDACRPRSKAPAAAPRRSSAR